MAGMPKAVMARAQKTLGPSKMRKNNTGLDFGEDDMDRHADFDFLCRHV